LEQFTFVKRGYDPEEVDKYITTLEQVIKSYKDKDNAIKNAIISAQVAADNVVRNAQAQADAYKLQISDQLEDMKNTLDLNRRRLQAFQDVYTSMVNRFMQDLEMSDMAKLVGKIEEMEQSIADLQGLEVVSGSKEEYLDQDQHREYRQPQPAHSNFNERPALRDFADDPREASRDFQREAPPHEMAREMPRETRGQGRDAMFPPQEPDYHEPPREMRQPPRDMMPSPQSLDPQRPPMRDTRPPLPAMPGREMPVRDPREALPPPQHEPLREDLRKMGPPSRDMMPPPQEQFRGEMPPMREPGRDMMRPPAPDHRDMRRDMGRDVRPGAGRDMRREPGGRDIMRDNPPPMRPDMIRPHPQDPQMRDPNRNYPPPQDSFGDHDQNLLPPVASLM